MDDFLHLEFFPLFSLLLFKERVGAFSGLQVGWWQGWNRSSLEKVPRCLTKTRVLRKSAFSLLPSLRR